MSLEEHTMKKENYHLILQTKLPHTSLIEEIVLN
jgi:hypothetical protein